MTLNDLMGIEHVVRVMPDGTAKDTESGVYAPEVHIELDEDGQVCEDEAETADRVKRFSDWELMAGYTGQYMAKGTDVIMHPSEYVGGQLEADILERPGLYVAVEVTGLWPTEEAEEAGSDEPIGWVVARKLDES